MSNPEPAPSTETQQPVTPVRRRRRFATLALVVMAAGVMVAATSCSPRVQAQSAIEASWPSYTVDCAMRVAKVESGYQADAMSPGGGNIGLFQVNSVHREWIQSTYGYQWEDLTDPVKNAEVAQGLSADAHRRLGDGWAPWRFGGAASTGCPR